MPLLRLSDTELDIVFAACRPIAPHRRSAFMTDIAAELARYPELGPGVVHRICATVQRKHFDVPDLSHDFSKHR
jgi:hypothetical protein